MAENLQHLKLTEVTRTRRKELERGSYAAVFEVMVQGTPCAAKEVYPILMSENTKKVFMQNVSGVANCYILTLHSLWEYIILALVLSYRGL